MSSTNEEHENFEHNIKKEPEEEFLCILPSFDSGNAYEVDLVQVKQENEIQSEEISKFQCKICQKAFGSIHLIRQHEKTHQNQKCKVCNMKIPPQSFEKHMKMHQKEKTERKFECKICSYKFLMNWQLKNHALVHSKRFQCDLCGYYSASSKQALLKHLTSHFVQGQYKCIFCRKLFDDRESFRSHSRQVHGDPKNRIGLTKADLSCRTCGKECVDVRGRKDHEKVHEEKVQCPICDKKCKPQSLPEHLKLHKLKKKGIKFTCDICGYENAHKCVLKDHLGVHLNPDKGECKICWKTFANTRSLQKHSRRIHNLNVQPSELCCNICQVKCKNLLALKHHERTHKYPKPCPVCCKSFTLQCFSKHIKSHELKKDEKKFECKLCRKKFHIKKSLSRHIKSHNKSLECDLCEYRTGRKESMKVHMANHMKIKPFECEKCLKTFQTAMSLKLHILGKHHGVQPKPFECEICRLGFSEKSDLIKHQSSHIKPFSCNLCPSSFLQKKNLNQHIKIHNKSKDVKKAN